MEKHTNKGMKKSIKLLATGLFAATLFVSGGLVSAQTDWMNQITMKNNEELKKATNTKINKLVGNIDKKVQSKIEGKVGTKMDSAKSDIDSKLQTYFDNEVEKIVKETGAYEEVVKRIDATVGTKVNYGKSQIDEALTEYVNNQ